MSLKDKYTIAHVDYHIAKELVQKYHYAKGGSNTRTHTIGMFDGAECVGVAWYLPPTRSSAEAMLPGNWQGVLSLSRFVLKPDLPKNSASFLLGRSMRMIATEDDRWDVLVTYADSFMGHVGTIYKATNWFFMGNTKKYPIWIRDEVMVSRKAGPKTRTHSEMVELGYEMVGMHHKIKFAFPLKDVELKTLVDCRECKRRVVLRYGKYSCECGSFTTLRSS